MKRKIMEQMCFCIIIALALFVSVNSGMPVLEKGAQTVLNYTHTSYTLEDVKEAAHKGAVFASALPGKVSGAIAVMTGKMTLGDPIDEDYENGRAAVYAAAGGEVTSAGENEEIGKYIRITHGSMGESLYGNLESVYVKVPERVRKGQVIGMYEKKEDKDFYFSFKEYD